MDSTSTFNAWYLRYVVKELARWRRKYPIERACHPLRADLHTHTEPTPMTDYDKRRQAEWNFDGK